VLEIRDHAPNGGRFVIAWDNDRYVSRLEWRGAFLNYTLGYHVVTLEGIKKE
jgi:hypothetical protein